MENRETCSRHGTRFMAYHEDGSATCGRCYMQRARELGVIKPLRKGTTFAYCARHAAWFEGETRSRQAECFVEGGPANAERCEGGRCEMRPGTDFFTADFVEDYPTAAPAAMDWPNAS